MKIRLVIFCYLFFGILLGRSGYCLYDVSNRKIVLKKNIDDKFAYASNIKLLTSVVALDKLGPSFRFETKFCFFSDTLLVKAGGDPTTVMEELYIIALNLQERGIGEINTVIVDDYLYGEKPTYPISKESSDRAYLANISPLSLNFNTYIISYMDGKAILRTPGDYFQVLYKASQNFKLATYPKSKKTIIEVNGESKKNNKFYKRVYHPREHYIETLLFYLDNKICRAILRKKLTEEDFAKGKNYIHKSKLLKDVLKSMNVYSSNFIAESIGFHLGLNFGEEGNFGRDVLKKFALEKLNENIEIEDCCGLGKSKISPEFFIKLLIYAHSKPFLGIDLFASLPNYGKEGTLGKYKQRYMIKAKTGSLWNVSSITGLLESKKDNYYFFTFVSNSNYSRAQKQKDKFLEKLEKNY